MLKSICRLFTLASTNPKPTRKSRLSVEPLEDRAVPTTWAAATVAELIQHINDANATPGFDTINLTSNSTYTLSALNNTTSGHNGLPVITDSDGLTIVGTSATATTIERSAANGTPDFRMFDVAGSGSLTLQNLTLQGGLVVGGGPPVNGNSRPAAGGAILNQGSLSLINVTLQNNTAQGEDGHVGFTFDPGPGGWSYGGAIYSNGSLSVTGSHIQNNAAIGGKGSDGGTYYQWGDYTYYKVTVPGGDGGDAFGGGIYVAGGTAQVTTSTVTGNSASSGAGGSHGGHKGHGYGGGLYIAPTVGVSLDAFSVGHAKRNNASTSDSDISGTYTVI